MEEATAEVATEEVKEAESVVVVTVATAVA